MKYQNLLFTHVSQGPQLSNVLNFFSAIKYYLKTDPLWNAGRTVNRV